ncbi:MAG: serine hydrolase [Arthrobacter koreensis]
MSTLPTNFPKTAAAFLLATVLSAAALAGCTGEPAPTTVTVPGSPETPSAGSEPELALRAELDSYAAQAGADFSVAIYEHGTGRAWSYHPEGRYLEASLVKVPILLTLLRQATEEERELTAEEEQLAELMICQSDNAATDELYAMLGGAEELQKTYGLLGVTGTEAGEVWGANETNAEDQLRIATAVALGVDWIRDGLQDYAAVLLENVVPEQAWGISAGILNPVAEVGLKNGWLQDDLLAWNVGSSGFVVGGSAEYSIVVLTAGTDSLDEGISLLEGAAAIVNGWEPGADG